MSAVIFRKGLDLKAAVAATLAKDYDSAIVDDLIGHGFRRVRGRLMLREKLGEFVGGLSLHAVA